MRKVIMPSLTIREHVNYITLEAKNAAKIVNFSWFQLGMHFIKVSRVYRGAIRTTSHLVFSFTFESPKYFVRKN